MNWSVNEVPSLNIRLSQATINDIHTIANRIGWDANVLANEVLAAYVNLINSFPEKNDGLPSALSPRGTTAGPNEGDK